MFLCSYVHVASCFFQAISISHVALVLGLYSVKFNFSCTTVTIRRPEGKISATEVSHPDGTPSRRTLYIDLGLCSMKIILLIHAGRVIL